jgi:hypothetical protein
MLLSNALIILAVETPAIAQIDLIVLKTILYYVGMIHVLRIELTAGPLRDVISIFLLNVLISVAESLLKIVRLFKTVPEDLLDVMMVRVRERQKIVDQMFVLLIT